MGIATPADYLRVCHGPTPTSDVTPTKESRKVPWGHFRGKHHLTGCKALPGSRPYSADFTGREENQERRGTGPTTAGRKQAYPGGKDNAGPDKPLKDPQRHKENGEELPEEQTSNLASLQGKDLCEAAQPRSRRSVVPQESPDDSPMGSFRVNQKEDPPLRTCGSRWFKRPKRRVLVPAIITPEDQVLCPWGTSEIPTTRSQKDFLVKYGLIGGPRQVEIGILGSEEVDWRMPEMSAAMTATRTQDAGTEV
ncbi:hypothetical protein NDU88_001615 [Pleurodeles waltl]|uniref:Uncharacterized protein n=1 Tax=Pleurodeles waltl TaxID=8319 RepID=A0AAV7KZ24_PLEWA|nr:hypothetical protein NDU88_001615 [Pleurodeles waltl]